MNFSSISGGGSDPETPAYALRPLLELLLCRNRGKIHSKKDSFLILGLVLYKVFELFSDL